MGELLVEYIHICMAKKGRGGGEFRVKGKYAKSKG